MSVHTNEDWIRRGTIFATDISSNQRHVRAAAIDFTFVGDQAKFSVLGFDHGLTHTMHVALVLHAVADQLRYGEHFHLVDAAELNQVGHTGHGAVVFHDFADDSGWDHTG